MGRENDGHETLNGDGRGRMVLLLQELRDFTLEWSKRFEEEFGFSSEAINSSILSDSSEEPESQVLENYQPQRKGGHLDSPATRAYARRRMRESIFGIEDIFGEPAWDILLDLESAREQGLKLTISDACLGACVPMTTALRYTKILEKRGLVEREADPGDARRQFLVLTELTKRKLSHYFQRCGKIFANEI